MQSEYGISVASQVEKSSSLVALSLVSNLVKVGDTGDRTGLGRGRGVPSLASLATAIPCRLHMANLLECGPAAAALTLGVSVLPVADGQEGEPLQGRRQPGVYC